MKRILLVSGSVQTNSGNRKLLSQLKQALDGQFELDEFEVLSLPHFNPDDDGPSAPETVLEWRASVARVALVVIASPEYGHSLPGVLKNAVDWLIPTGEFYQKPVCITCAVGHQERGRKGLLALRTTLLAVDADIRFDQPTVNGDMSELIAAISKAVE